MNPRPTKPTEPSGPPSAPDSAALREAATDVARRLQAAGHEAFWVGGCVRDFLLGREPADYDLATSARPAQVEALFSRTLPVGRQFGVMLVRHRGAEFQVATFRAEADYTDGRRPDRVEFTHARADAQRRDFTINGLFHDPVRGVTHDWVGGKADLRRRLVRTIGDPRERFAEDRLRPLRAVRFAARLGFTIEHGTLAAIREQPGLIRSVSAERVRDELLKLFRPPHAARGLELLRDSGLLAVVLPEVAAFIGCAQPPEFHPEGDVFEHVRLMLDQLPADAPPALPWAVLLHDVGKPATATRDPDTGRIRFHGHDQVGAELAEKILRRFRFPRRQIEEIVTVVRHHMQLADAPRMRRAKLRRLLLRPTFPLELELHRLDCLGSDHSLELHDFLTREAAALAERPRLRPPLVNGHDLMALGIPPGPELGRWLREIRDRQLAEELTTREAALNWVKKQLP